MKPALSWNEIFKSASRVLFSSLKEGEILNLNFMGEETDFVRFNKSKIRQPSFVEQGEITLELTFDKKKADHTVTLTLNPDSNGPHLKNALERLRSEVRTLPEDPFISEISNQGQSSVVVEGSYPQPEEFIKTLVPLVGDIDLAGLLTSGNVYRGNANSLGQFHWFSSSSFLFDYSLYTTKEKAVKGMYAGTDFKTEELNESLNQSARSLALMTNKQVVKPPGKYRAYLAPAAVLEITGILNWHGLSGGAYKRGEFPFKDLFEGKRNLSPLLTLKENFALGLSPRFNEWGEVSAEEIVIVENGKMKNLLVSKQTSNEYGLPSNQAAESEGARSLEIETGNLSKSEILKELGTGFYISNLHYLNWSDKVKARVTGMTRFGCLWVEDGEIVGPIKDMRFDDTLYHLFGEGLEALTDFSEVSMSTSTYYRRDVGGSKVPGALVRDMSFTL